MRILFLMRNHGYITHYESPLRMLAARGHRIFIGSRGAERHYSADMAASMDRLCRDHPNISVHKLPPRQDDWAALTATLRALRNYSRYLHPRYANAHQLRARAGQQVAKVAGFTRLPRGRLAGRVIGAMASAIERRLPVDPVIEETIARFAPDVLVVTPLVDFNSYQPDYVTAAARLGIPTVWAVASWDNLTNKGVVGTIPDRVLVWNDAQRQEAVELQGVPPARVIATGAQTFDPWFTLSPSLSRDEFCDLVGLPRGPYLLYLCSSRFVAPDEAAYVCQWLSQLRASRHEVLRRASVLIRPHPANAAQWASVDLEPFGVAVLWPPRGDLPIDAAAKQRYFDSLFHASVLVGVNSSSMIEGAIVGRRSFTLLAPEFAHSQRGTLHFEHLRTYGIVTTATTWDEHLAQIAAAFRAPEHVNPEALDRMMAFVRPAGAGQTATPRVVAAIEEASCLAVAVRGPTSSTSPRMLAPLARAAARGREAARAARRAAAEQAEA